MSVSSPIQQKVQHIIPALNFMTPQVLEPIRESSHRTVNFSSQFHQMPTPMIYPTLRMGPNMGLTQPMMMTTQQFVPQAGFTQEPFLFQMMPMQT